MKGTLIDIQHIPGDYAVTQGHKGYEHSRYKNGRYIKPTGFGYAIESKPSQLIAYVRVNDFVVSTRLDFYFKRELGRLTSKRIAAIIKAAPRIVSLKKEVGNYGNTYYVINKKDMDSWLNVVCELL